MREKIYYMLLEIYLILVLLWLFIGSILNTYEYIDSTLTSLGLFVFAILGIILYIFYKFIQKKYSLMDYLIVMMSLLGYLSYCNAFDKRVALIGFIDGREGLLAILSYYMIFLLSTTVKNEKIRKDVFKLLTLIGIIFVFYGVLQIFGIFSFLGIPIVGQWKYASSLLNNSNFMGAFCVLMSGLWLGKYFFEDIEKINYKSLIVLFIFVLGLLISGAMSAFVALIVMMLIIIFIYFFVFRKRFNIKKVFLKVLNIFLIFLISFIFVNCCNSNELIKDVRILNSEVFNSATSGLKKEYGTGRVHIWKESLKYFPKYIWTGVGIDNFIYLGKNEFVTDYISGVKYSKAHNEYLQILLTEGIFMFVIYLLFLGIIFIKSLLSIFRNKKVNYVVLSLFLAYFGYCIQAFFNISMIKVAPIFYMISGMLVSCVEGEKLKY